MTGEEGGKVPLSPLKGRKAEYKHSLLGILNSLFMIIALAGNVNNPRASEVGEIFSWILQNHSQGLLSLLLGIATSRRAINQPLHLALIPHDSSSLRINLF